jgi:hypothetical protein
LDAGSKFLQPVQSAGGKHQSAAFSRKQASRVLPETGGGTRDEYNFTLKIHASYPPKYSNPIFRGFDKKKEIQYTRGMKVNKPSKALLNPLAFT